MGERDAADEERARDGGDAFDGGPWHGPAFVVLVVLTVVVLGALMVHRHDVGSGGSSASASPASGTTVPPGAPAASAASAATISVPGFATPQDYLACVRRSESRDEYGAVSPSGTYFGAYQFDQTTWNNTVEHAGLTSLFDVQPNEATPAAQDEVAMALLQWQGTTPWAGDC